MGAAKANNSKDTYLATAVTFIVIGALYLIDKLIHFSSIGLPWVMNKDNMLLYASICCCMLLPVSLFSNAINQLVLCCLGFG